MRLPKWIKDKLVVGGPDNTKRFLQKYKVFTVCEEARCPNRKYCFSKPTATFMILGNVCTRGCAFCSISVGIPNGVDPTEPERVALAAKEMGLKYVVVTSVTRDDLDDGGAEQFVKTIEKIKYYLPHAKVEVLTPDFRGAEDSIKKVVDAGPNVFNHNVETVPRLYSSIRAGADYKRSLHILRLVKYFNAEIFTKSGLMVGLGEKFDEVISVMEDLKNVGCDILTIGQYLRPSKRNVMVVDYIKPDVFERYKDIALKMGFKYVASGPLVRSSMNAEQMYY